MERMTSPIIVGIDPVREDPAPVHLAAVLSDLTGAPVIAVAVHPQHPLPTGLVPPGYDALLRDRAHAALRRARRQLPAGSAAHAISARSLAGALHDVACEADAGLLVVGRAHRGRVGRVLAGSVADGVLDGAACPVAVAPRGYAPPSQLTTIGAGFVETVEGRAAVAGAASVAARAGAALDLISAVPPVDWTGIAPPGAAYREALALARDAAGHAARAAAEEIAPGVRAIVHAVVESPVTALAEASEGLDLLVCGSRGYGPLRRVLLGSVSRPLSHIAHCPLVVLPRGGVAPLERTFSAVGRDGTISRDEATPRAAAALS
jgi:nucleotide-binding universal stress UspA family protein